MLEERDFDGALKGIEDAADRVDETAPGSVQKKAKDDWTGWEMLFFFLITSFQFGNSTINGGFSIMWVKQ